MPLLPEICRWREEKRLGLIRLVRLNRLIIPIRSRRRVRSVEKSDV